MCDSQGDRLDTPRVEEIRVETRGPSSVKTGFPDSKGRLRRLVQRGDKVLALRPTGP